MYQKDYILRMIEMIAEVIARIIGLAKKGDSKQASKILENSYRDFLKEDASYFRKIPQNQLTTELLSKHNYTNGHLQILAELFFVEGELQFTNNNISSGLEYFEKSLSLFEFVEKESNEFSLSLEKKINILRYRLNQN